MGLQDETAVFQFNLASTNLAASAAFRVSEAIQEFEYLYNFLSLFDQHESGILVRWDDVETILIERGHYGLVPTNLRLREIHANHELDIQHISSRSPIKITFRGVFRAIKALVTFFDPIKTESRSEDLRHKKRRNEIDEQKEELKLIGERIKRVRELSAFERGLRDRSSPEVAERVVDLVRLEMSRILENQIRKGTIIRYLENGDADPNQNET